MRYKIRWLCPAISEFKPEDSHTSPSNLTLTSIGYSSLVFEWELLHELLHHKVDWFSTGLLPHKKVDWCSTGIVAYLSGWCSTDIVAYYSGLVLHSSVWIMRDARLWRIQADRYEDICLQLQGTFYLPIDSWKTHSVFAYYHHRRQKVWHDWYPLSILLQVFYTELGCDFSCHHWVR